MSNAMTPEQRAAAKARIAEIKLLLKDGRPGKRTAHILTIVATCVAHGINPRAYLHLVTKRLVDRWPQATSAAHASALTADALLTHRLTARVA